MTKPEISIKTDFIIILALSLLIMPIQWIVSWLVATAFHELFHFITLKLCGFRIFRMEVGLNGAIMDTDLSDNKKEIFCVLSGPIGSILLIFIGRWLPRVAVCGLFQCLYNLIPIYPLDGGRAVRCILKRRFSEPVCTRIEIFLENSILFLFVILGAYATFYLKLGLIPLLFSGILIMKNKQGKCTCKERPLGVK